MAIKVKDIDSHIERQILTGMITSTDFFSMIVGKFNPDWLPVPYTAKLAKIILAYYDTYRRAPNRDIMSVVESNKKIFSKEEYSLVQDLIVTLDAEYDAEINVKYLFDKSTNYFEAAGLEYIADEMKKALEIKDTQGALKAFESYRKSGVHATKWHDLMTDVSFAQKVYDIAEEPLFIPRGRFGKFTGPLNRGWLLAILAPMKRGKSTAETSILTLDDGTQKTIKDIVLEKRDKVASMFNDGATVGIKKVAAWHDSWMKKLWRITTRTGRYLDLSAEHKSLTPTGYLPTAALEVGDAIAVPRRIPIFGKKVWPAFKSRLLAYIIADGGCTGPDLSFTKYDKEHANDFCSCVTKMGDTFRKEKSGNTYAILGGKQSKVNQWIDSFVEVIGKLSKQKSIPQDVFRLKKSCLAEFLRALFSGDGSMEASGQISYSSASKELIRQVQHLLLRFGVISVLKKKNPKRNEKSFSAWELTIRDKENILKFLDEIGFLFAKADKALKIRPTIEARPDKRGFVDRIPSEMLPAIMQEVEQFKPFNRTIWSSNEMRSLQQAVKNNKSVSRMQMVSLGKIIGSFDLQALEYSDIMWDPIISIVYIGKRQCYDITVPETQNFICNDIVTHNSWYLLELAMQALYAGKKVAFISLEIDSYRLATRFYKNVTGGIDDLDIKSKYVIIPRFNCQFYKQKSCKLPQMLKAKNPEGNPNWVCTVCRDNFKWQDNYRQDVSYFEVEKDHITVKQLTQHFRGLATRFGKSKLRLCDFPAFSASLTDIEEALDTLEFSEGFIPDVLIIDYADILASEIRNADILTSTNDVWIRMKQIAAQRNILLATASQGKRDSIERRQIKQTDVSWDIRKLAHVDVMWGLSQTPEEKRAHMMRMTQLAHRWRDFNQLDELLFLQQYEIAQPYLDCEMLQQKKAEDPTPTGEDEEAYE